MEWKLEYSYVNKEERKEYVVEDDVKETENSCIMKIHETNLNSLKLECNTCSMLFYDFKIGMQILWKVCDL
jgi:hypothetical protein